MHAMQEAYIYCLLACCGHRQCFKMALKVLGLLVLIVSVVSDVVASQKTLNFIFICSKSFPEVAAAVQLAVKHVNTSPSVDFKGYALDLTIRPATCNHRSSQSVFFETLQTDPYQVAIVGAGCSEATTGVAETARHYNVPMLSYSSTSQELEDRNEFPNVFRTVPSDRSVTMGIAAFLATYQEWRRVVVLTQNTQEYKLETIELVRELREMNLSVSTTLLLPEELDPLTPDSLFPPDHRIFVLNMGPAAARFVICEAIKRGLERYEYVWVLQGSYPDYWWGEADDVDCNATTLASFLRTRGAVAISYFPLIFNWTIPSDITGITPQNLSAAVNSTSPSIHYAYDAVLVLAKGLNQTLTQVNVSADLSDLVESVRKGMIKNLNESDPLQGVSGQIEFENGARVVDRVSVHQYKECSRGTCLRPVGTIPLLIDKSTVEFINGESREGLWGESIPSDGTPIIEHSFHRTWLVVISYLYASLVIVGAFVSLIFTCVFRNRKLVRLTSPNMNLVIALGVIIFNTGDFLFIYPPVAEQVLTVFCALRVWIIAIGFTLCFGTINAKMWRIYYIFYNPNPSKKKRPLMDWHLLLIVMGFVLVDLIVLVTVSFVSTARLVPVREPDMEHPDTVNSDGITVKYEVTLCESQSRVIWVSILFGYKGVIQAIGIFLALRIRNVKIKVLNDSKEIAATLYLSSAILAVVLIISVALPTHLSIYSAGYSFGIPLATSVVLIVVFFTKMWRLWRDPRGEKIFTQAPQTFTSPAVNATPGGTSDFLDDKVSSLQRQVRALQLDLARCKAQGLSDEMNDTALTIILDNSAIESPVSSSNDCEKTESITESKQNGAPTESKHTNHTTFTLDDHPIPSNRHISQNDHIADNDQLS